MVIEPVRACVDQMEVTIYGCETLMGREAYIDHHPFSSHAQVHR